jgi:hypothetical protein
MPHGFTSYIVTIDYARVIKTREFKMRMSSEQTKKA